MRFFTSLPPVAVVYPRQRPPSKRMTDDAEPSPLMDPVSNTVSASTLISVSVPFFSVIVPYTANVQFVSVIRPGPHAPLFLMVLPPMAV